MTFSLKAALHNAIKCYNGKTYPIDEVSRLCTILHTDDGGHYKFDNATRRLRELTAKEDSDIQAVVNHKKHIVGYRFKRAGELF